MTIQFKRSMVFPFIDYLTAFQLTGANVHCITRNILSAFTFVVTHKENGFYVPDFKISGYIPAPAIFSGGNVTNSSLFSYPQSFEPYATVT